MKINLNTILIICIIVFGIVLVGLSTLLIQKRNLARAKTQLVSQPKNNEKTISYANTETSNSPDTVVPRVDVNQVTPLPQEAVIAITDSAIQPADFKILLNNKVKWKNDSSQVILLSTFDGSITDQKIAPGDVFEIPFAAPGVTQYTASAPGKAPMQGLILAK